MRIINKLLITFSLTGIFYLTSQNIHGQQPPQVFFTETAGAFSIAGKNHLPAIVIDTTDAKVVQIAADALANDVERISGRKPVVLKNPSKLPEYAIVIGTAGQSKYINKLSEKADLPFDSLKGTWERYIITQRKKPVRGVKEALIIAGSDRRGTAYGVFELSRRMGVSPWYWWADVLTDHHKTIMITADNYLSHQPSVKYRGIFLNDEDWGLQPWAAKTLEPETGDIGPKTYAKIFELLLRLKANLIWPAMHPCTKAFYHYPKNKVVADNYAIVVGSSHAEPMLRDNVYEWHEEEYGPYDYGKNRQQVYDYWKERAIESAPYENIYTIGMRGIHDSGIKGFSTQEERVAAMDTIISDQRKIIKNQINPDASKIPQAFIPYKEVLDLYDAGLQIPDDVTIIWPDDNYGYIRRLNSPEENKRSGGSGIYYHLSYWGRPHDYLWLSTTHPLLIREELTKAYQTGAKRMWVINVGDIKPAEYNLSLSMDMAWDIGKFQNGAAVNRHMKNWLAENVSKEHAGKLANVFKSYYDLAYERRPEFMGWSQTEPTRPTHLTAYNHFYYGDQAEQRIEDYQQIQQKVRILKDLIPAARADAYFELVFYPVTCASLMNKKFLYFDKANLYDRQQRLSARTYADLSNTAYDSIVQLTDYYNNKLADGKWKHIISMKPRNLPVFAPPKTDTIHYATATGWSISPEGDAFSADTVCSLPVFPAYAGKKFFIDLYLKGNKNVDWKIADKTPWINVSELNGTLDAASGKTDARLWVTLQKDKLPKEESLTGIIILKGNDKKYTIKVPVFNPELNSKHEDRFAETNGYLSVFAEDLTVSNSTASGLHWKNVAGPSHTGGALEALPVIAESDSGYTENRSAASVSFRNFTTGEATIHVIGIPVHPVNDQHSVRVAVQLDDGKIMSGDFITHGRSEQWKQNVLSNTVVIKLPVTINQAGWHTLKIYPVDPGVIIDQVLIDFGGLRQGYGVIEETRMK